MTAEGVAPAPTALRLTGRDALELLHRLTTQFLRDLAPGACRTTLFCDFRGRVQHRAAVACTADGAVWLLRSDAPAAELAAAVEAQIFRDRVAIEDRSVEWSVVPAYAAAAASNEAPVATGTLTERDGVPERVALPDGTTLTLRARSTAAATPDLGAAASEAARIRAGAPRHGHELHSDWNPFEIGCAGDVHLDKGCFTGQEALLRMMTYGSVRRRLVLLEGAGSAPVTRAIRSGDDDAGVVTSVAPAGAGWVALAVVRREAIDSGGALAIEGGAALTRVAPFPEQRPAGLPEPRSPR